MTFEEQKKLYRQQITKELDQAISWNKPVRIFYGDPVTGEDLLMLFDVYGYPARIDNTKAGGTDYVLISDKNNLCHASPIQIENIVKMTREHECVFGHINYHHSEIEIGPAVVSAGARKIVSVHCLESARRIKDFLEGRTNTL